MSSDIAGAAQRYLSAGLSVIPVGADKRPLIAWKAQQTQYLTPSEVVRLFGGGARVAIVAGKISGNLECIDFDDPDVYRPLLDMVEAQAPGLAVRLAHHQTPSGGYHIIYRRETPPAGNQVLAKNLDNKSRIETRGEGGYFLAPPSDGYTVLAGNLCALPVLTDTEVNLLFSTARFFHADIDEIISEPLRLSTADTDSPGTIFCRENSVASVLAKYGWQPCGKTTAGEGWTRPGKDEGVSGVLLSSTGNFYCWSTSTPLTASRSYTSFGLYAAYEFGGDYSAAARSLIKRGVDGKTSVSPASAPRRDARSNPVSVIMQTVYAPLRWAVPGIIPEGMTILAGRPKFGKSWLMLGLSYAVATGGLAWGYTQTQKRTVHYLALEDSERRIQDRIRQMEGYFDEYPKNLHIYTDFPRIGEGFIEELTSLAEREPDTGLIIIDTLQKVRPITGGKRGGANLYQVEYEDYEKIQRWSIRNGIPVICIHHTRKGDPSRVGNPFDEMSGSTGIQGVADTLIVVDKPKGSNEGMMYVTGREVCENDYPMIFHRHNMTWEIRTPEDTTVDPTPMLIQTWFASHPDEGMTVKDAAVLLELNQASARRRLDQLVDEGELVRTKDKNRKNLAVYHIA